MLKTIIFDLGNVLVFFSHPQMIRQIAACTGIEAAQVKSILFDEGIQNFYETGQIDTAHYCQIFKTRSKSTFSDQDLIEAASNIFTPNTSIYPIVEAIKKKGLRLIVLSNTSECHFARVKSRYPVFDLFDNCVLSYEVGALKPSPSIYQKALSLTNCPPGNCFFTDDIPSFVEGARKLGIDSELFTGAPALKTALAARGLIL